MNKTYNLPPLASDFSGVLSVANDMEISTILYSPGGCATNIIEIDEIDPNYNMYKTNLNDIDVIVGTENKVIDALLKNDLFHNRRVLLVGTTVTDIVSADYGMIQKKVSDKIELIPIETNGFDSYKSGIKKLLKSIKLFSSNNVTEKPTIQIIGHSKLDFGRRELLNEPIAILEGIGFGVNFLGAKKTDGLIETASTIYWIISLEAEIFKSYCIDDEIRKIIYGFPVGNIGMKSLLDQLDKIVPIEYIYDYCEISNDFYKGKVVIIGEYATSIAIGKCFEHDFGFKDIEIGVFKAEYKEIDKDTLFVNEFNEFIIKDESDILEKTRDVDIIIADPLLDKVFEFTKKNKKFIPIPYYGISGRTFSKMNYGLIGNDGISYFIKYLTKKEAKK